MNLGFEIFAARSKKATGEDDAPSQQPMKAGMNPVTRRNPMTDERKVRRQMARQKTASVDQGVNVTQRTASHRSWKCEKCGATVTSDGGYDTTCDKCGAEYNASGQRLRDNWRDNQSNYDDDVDDMTGYENSFHDSARHMEAKILNAMASAKTLQAQQAIAAELDTLRQRRTASVQADRDLDLGSAVMRDHLTPVLVHEHHTASTDWIGEVTAQMADVDGRELQQHMLTEASLWFGKTSAEVKADREEFGEQAWGYARHLAGQYGQGAAVAEKVFLDHVDHLYRSAGLHTAGNPIEDYRNAHPENVVWSPDKGWKDTWGEPDGPENPDPTPWDDEESTGGDVDGIGSMRDSVSASRRQATPTPIDDTAYNSDQAKQQSGEGQSSLDADPGDPPDDDPQDPINEFSDTGPAGVHPPESATGQYSSSKHAFKAHPAHSGICQCGRFKEAHRVQASEDVPCASCGKPVGPLEVFPNVRGKGSLCQDCYAKTPEGRYVPTADELARMWGGGGKRRGSRVQAADDGSRYKITRFFQDERPSKTIRRGLTLDEAQAHCNRDDTHGEGWFDGYDHDSKPRTARRVQAEVNGKESSRKHAGTHVMVTSKPTCDVCKSKPAEYDSRLPGLGGSWGNVCQTCFDRYGPGQLGTGHAQKLVDNADDMPKHARRVHADDKFNTHEQSGQGVPSDEGDPSNPPNDEPMWPWELSGPGTGAADVKDVKFPYSASMRVQADGMFPGPNSQVYYNEDGEPLGWDEGGADDDFGVDPYDYADDDDDDIDDDDLDDDDYGPGSPDWQNLHGPGGTGEFSPQSSRHTAGNPHPVGTPNWFEYEDPDGAFKDDPGQGPRDGVPGGGIPLHGPLSPEQQEWMDKGKRATRRVAIRTQANEGADDPVQQRPEVTAPQTTDLINTDESKDVPGDPARPGGPSPYNATPPLPTSNASMTAFKARVQASLKGTV